jgi:hypothetical protein
MEIRAYNERIEAVRDEAAIGDVPRIFQKRGDEEF